MMMDWNEYQKQIGKMIGELMKLSPDTVQAIGCKAPQTPPHEQAWRENAAIDLAPAVAVTALRRLHHRPQRLRVEGWATRKKSRRLRGGRCDECRRRTGLFHAGPGRSLPPKSSQ